MTSEVKLFLIKCKKNRKIVLIFALIGLLVMSAYCGIKVKSDTNKDNYNKCFVHFTNTLFLKETGEKTYNYLPVSDLLVSDYIIDDISKELGKENIEIDVDKVTDLYGVDYNNKNNIVTVHVYVTEEGQAEKLNEIILEACFAGMEYYTPSIDIKMVNMFCKEEQVARLDDGTTITESEARKRSNYMGNLIAHAIIGAGIGTVIALIYINLRQKL